MDAYFKFKLILECIIPISLIVAAIVIGITVVVMSDIKEKRIEKFFLSNGYERKLLGVPLFGDGEYYGWVRESDNTIIDDRDIQGWSLRRIKKNYK